MITLNKKSRLHSPIGLGGTVMDPLGARPFTGVPAATGAKGRNVTRGPGDEGPYWVPPEDGGGGGGGAPPGG